MNFPSFSFLMTFFLIYTAKIPLYVNKHVDGNYFVFCQVVKSRHKFCIMRLIVINIHQNVGNIMLFMINSKFSV